MILFKKALVLTSVLFSSSFALATEGFIVCTDVRGNIYSAAIDGEANVTHAKLQGVDLPVGQQPTALEVTEVSMIDGKVSITFVIPGEEEQQVFAIKAKKLNGTSDAIIEDWVGDTLPTKTKASCTVKFRAGI